MSEFLVEAYLSRSDSPVDELHFHEVSPVVRFVRSIFVPEDETCFYLFEAPSVEAVREAAHRAGLQVERVSEATVAADRNNRADKTP